MNTANDRTSKRLVAVVAPAVGVLVLLGWAATPFALRPTMVYLAVSTVLAVALWRMGRRTTVALAAAIALYSLVPVYIYVERPDIIRRTSSRLVGRTIDVEYVLDYIGVSLVLGLLAALVLTAIRTLLGRAGERTSRRQRSRDTTFAVSPQVIDAGLFVMLVYLVGSALVRWGAASYRENDVIKGQPIDQFLFNLCPMVIAALTVVAIEQFHRRRLTPTRVALLAATLVAYVAVTVRIGARAQLLFLFLALLPACVSLLRSGRGGARLRRTMVIVAVVAIATVGIASVRALRSPYYEGQGALRAGLEELVRDDALLDQDYNQGGLVLLMVSDEMTLDVGTTIHAEIGAAVPLYPADNLSVEFARSIDDPRALRNEGYGTTPLVAGFVIFGGAAVLYNAVMFALASVALEWFSRFGGRGTAGLVSAGIALAAALSVARSQWGNALFYPLAFGLIPVFLARAALAEHRSGGPAADEAVGDRHRVLADAT